MIRLVIALLLVVSPALAGDLPDPRLTPGVTNQTLTAAKLCSKTFRTSSVRNVPTATKKKVFQSYGINCTDASGRPISRISGFPKQIIFTVPNLFTDDAQSLAFLPNAGVISGVGVPALAMSASSFFRAGANATQDILSMRYGFEMIRIDAARITTGVIEFHRKWDVPSTKLERENVCAGDSSFIEHAPISAGFEDRACPVPAIGRGIDQDAVPERFVKRLILATPAHAGENSKSLLRCKDFEIDHLVSLEIGGSNDIKNLWPQSYITKPMNAHIKDRLENRLHKLVCSGALDLETAQHEIASDWIAAYKTYLSENR